MKMTWWRRWHFQCPRYLYNRYRRTKIRCIRFGFVGRHFGKHETTESLEW